MKYSLGCFGFGLLCLSFLSFPAAGKSKKTACESYRVDDPAILIRYEVEAPKVALFLRRSGELCKGFLGESAEFKKLRQLTKEEMKKAASLVRDFPAKAKKIEKNLGKNDKLNCMPSCGSLLLLDGGKESSLMEIGEAGFQVHDVKTYEELNSVLKIDLKEEISKLVNE